MKNLIEEKLKEILNLCELTEEKYQIKPKGFLVDNYLRIQDDINTYNIIAAPNSIKLSEIVDKLETIYFVDYNIHRVNNDIYIHEKGTTYYSNFNIEISNKKITDIQLDYLFDEAKELYTLWITGTEIIDDLKEEE